MANFFKKISDILKRATSMDNVEGSQVPALPSKITQLLNNLQTKKTTEAEFLAQAKTMILNNEEIISLCYYLEQISQEQPQPPLANLLAKFMLELVNNIKVNRLQGIILGTCARTFKGKQETINLAININKKALAIFRLINDMPHVGDILNNLGENYSSLSSKENLAEAIRCYKEAISIYKKHNSPVKYAMTINNLGNAYRKLPKNRGKNLAEAIRCYKEAISIYTQQDFPVNNAMTIKNFYAMTINNLGDVYCELPSENRKENLAEAIRCFKQALSIYKKHNSEGKYALAMNSLGNAYRELPSENRRESLEEAIRCHKEALLIWKKEVSPVNYAIAMNNLGNAYRELPSENRRENLEEAIRCYKEALLIRTKKDFPVDYALTIYNQGNAYTGLPSEREQNLNKAIRCFKQALSIYNKKDFPDDYALAINSLGSAYAELPSGNRVNNLTKAIRYFEKALSIYKKQGFPVYYAMTMSNLGNAYTGLPSGDRSQNLYKAINCYKKAISIYTKQEFPCDYAMTIAGMGNVYLNLSTGNRADNLVEAIHCYEEALLIRTKKDFPIDYALIINNMGLAYFSLPNKERSHNLTKAVRCYKEALSIRTKKDSPIDYATTMNNLGNAYRELPNEQEQNLAKAIRCYKEALLIRTKKDFPIDYATTMNNLGNAYADLSIDDRGENLSKAIGCYKEALQIRKQQNLWEDILQTSRNVIILYFEKKDWNNVIVEAKETLNIYNQYWGIIFLSESKKTLANTIFDAFSMLSYAFLQKGRFLDAITVLDEGSSRHLSEILRMGQELPKNIPEPIRKKALLLYQEIQELRPKSGKVDRIESYKEKIQEFKELMKPYRPERTGTLRDFLPHLNHEKAALLYLNVTSHGGFYALVHDADPKEKDMFKLSKVNYNVIKKFYEDEKDGWGTLYNQDRLYGRGKLFELAEVKIQNFANQCEFNKILQRIEEMGIKKLVILPQGILHTFPFGGIKEIPEDLEICFAPNAQLLLNSYQSTRVTDRNQISFTGFANPCEDTKLFFTNAEVAYISSLMHSKGNKNAKIYWGRKGNKQAISDDGQESTFLHFSTHGLYDPKDVENSCLFLFKDQLHLRDIYQLKFPSCFMVGMSACETGIPDLKSPGEYTCLTAGFHQAGAKVVVSTLWPVFALSTSLLMGEFYRCFLHDGLSPAYAMRQAQKWLKESSPVLIVNRLREYRTILKVEKEKLSLIEEPWVDSQINIIRGSLIAIESQINKLRETNIPPFQNPYYWAGFIVNGWGF